MVIDEILLRMHLFPGGVPDCCLMMPAETGLCKRFILMDAPAWRLHSALTLRSLAQPPLHQPHGPSLTWQVRLNLKYKVSSVELCSHTGFVLMHKGSDDVLPL